MSRLEWLLLFLVFVVYVVLGGVVLMHLEGTQEVARIALQRNATRTLQDLVQRSLVDGNPERLDALEQVAKYCGKPLLPENATFEEEGPFAWDFYNSFFVAVTIVSTIGYGNMAPTTFGTRMFCIGYALVGIPLNGILLAGLGEYFSRTFLRAHHRYKEEPRGGCQLFLKVIQYLVAGLALFILLPGVVFALAEGWTYDEAVYYAFITLATIGFGDYVAGFMSKESEWGHRPGLLGAYRAFIVLWIMFGLGYLAMILSFITRAMRSSRLRRLEQKLARRIKGARLWPAADIGYLRRVLNELYMLKFKVHCSRKAAVGSRSAFSRSSKKACRSSRRLSGFACRRGSSQQRLRSSRQPPSSSRSSRLAARRTHPYSLVPQPVYRARRSVAAAPTSRGRSRSLTLDEPPGVGGQPQLPRSLSESCLDFIDRDATFSAAAHRVSAADLLATVAAAAAAVEEHEAGAHHGLSDADILADEMTSPSRRSTPPPPSSRRGSSRLNSPRPSIFAALSRRGSTAAPSLSRRGSAAPSLKGALPVPPPSSRRGSLVNGDAKRLKGRETSLRRVLAERNLTAASQQTSPVQGRRPTLENYDAMARRRSEGVVLRRPTDELFSELDGTTVGDLLRALHALHSRRGSVQPEATLTFEDETRPDTDDDWDGKSVQISRL